MKKLKALISIMLSTIFLVSCASQNQGGPSAGHGLSAVFRGIGHLILSPLQIAAGLVEGVASLPYYASTSLSGINDGLTKAQAKITLEDTYDSAYGKNMREAGPEGDTGQVFRRMRNASEDFQRVLKQYGVPNSERYILTSIDTANKEGATLFAVVYRPVKEITVTDKYDGKTVRRFAPEDRLYYEPFEKDANGNSLDVIIDWAGVPAEYYKTQKQQAVLLTLAANAVVEGRRRTDYWAAERGWIAGQFGEILKQQDEKVRKSLQI
ncbi:MAG: hypothetical protein ACKVQA_13965 [Burkholderiales bacterium]